MDVLYGMYATKCLLRISQYKFPIQKIQTTAVHEPVTVFEIGF